MKTYLRILSYSRPFRNYVPLYIPSSIIAIVFGLINLILLKPFLEIIFELKTPEEIALYKIRPAFEYSIEYLGDLFNYYLYHIVEVFGKFESLAFVCLVILVSVLISNVFKYIAVIIIARVKVKIIKHMRLDVFNNVIRMHIGFFTDTRKGDVLSRISNDMQEVETSIQNSLKIIFRDPATIIIYFGYLFYTSYQLTLFTLIFLPVAGGIIAEIAKRLKRKAVTNQVSLGKLLNIFDESLSGMRVIHAFNATRYIKKIFGNEVNWYARTNLSFSKRFELAGPISEFLGVISVICIVLFGGSLVLNKEFMEPTSFMTYLIVFTQVLQPAKNISSAVTSIQRGIASSERIFELVDLRPKIKDQPDAVELEEFTDSIEFNNVYFSYEKEMVLKNINVTVPKGKTVALVGPSGGGKSTMADLVPRFYDPVKGEVRIDGKSIKKYKLASIRKHMGIVTQESILFNDTVFNNIAFGLDDVNEEKVIQAAKIANAHDFIMQMEDQYQTVIGERGSKLSGGQRQRISIARAVLKNPPILVLDEATSALDTQSEKLVQEALFNLMKNRTSLVIAHRLSTIQHADLILVIKDGEIIEQGTHSELIDEEGFYFKLIDMQSV